MDRGDKESHMSINDDDNDKLEFILNRKQLKNMKFESTINLRVLLIQL